MRMIAKDPKERWPALRDAVPMLARGLPPEADSGRPALAELVRRTSTERPAFAITPASPMPHRPAKPAEPRVVSAPRTQVARPEIKTLELVPSRFTLESGTTQAVRCRALDVRGKELSASAEWSSSDPNVASVDDAGTVTAHSVGTVTIAAMVEEHAAMATVEVVAMSVARLDVEPSIVSLPEHGTVRLNVRAYTAKGKQVAQPDVTFRSTDAAVASVAADGTLTGIARGQTTAMAHVGSLECRIIVTVTPAVVKSLGIEPVKPTVVVGQELALTATATDASGHKLGGHAVTWRSLTPSVAKVNARGRVTAKQPGTATIVAAYDGIESRTDVTVTAAAAKRSPVGMLVGLAAVALAGFGVWKYMSRAGTALPSTTPAPIESASAGAVAAQPAATAPAPAPVPVVTPPAAPIPTPSDTLIATIDLTETSPARIELGDARTLGVKATNRRGQLVPLSKLKWESSNPAIATVDSAGYLTTVALGRTIIAARGAGHERVLAVDVRAPVPASIVVAITHDSLEVGDTTTALVQVLDKREARLEQTVVWRSSNPAVATVDETGTVHAVGVGQATIGASAAAIADSINVFVAPARPTVSDAGLDSARLASSSLRAIAPNRTTSRAPAPRAEAALPPGVRAPTDVEAKAIADSIVTMIGRRVVRISQLTKSQGDVGVRFVKFLDKETPTARVASAPMLGEIRATSARVSFGVVLEWRTFTQSKRDRTVNVDTYVEPVRGGWAIREMRFPTGFAP
jgi:uncharacterized protein YjdB